MTWWQMLEQMDLSNGRRTRHKADGRVEFYRRSMCTGGFYYLWKGDGVITAWRYSWSFTYIQIRSKVRVEQCLHSTHKFLACTATCLPYFTVQYNIWTGDTQWRRCFRHYATSRKVADSIPDGVIGIFQWHNPSGRNVAMGVESSSNRNEYQEYFLGWQPYHLHVPIVLKYGSLNLLEPSGPLQSCNGTALPLYNIRTEVKLEDIILGI